MKCWNWQAYITIAGLLVFIIYSHPVDCSLGDKLEIFQDCLIECIETTCGWKLDQDDEFQEQEVGGTREIPWYSKLAGWSCPDECNHECQWTTINELQRQGFPRHAMPQFYGKWTFMRVGPIQEPASMFFSILNAIATWIGWRKYSSKIKPFLRQGHFGLLDAEDCALKECHVTPLVSLVRAQWEFYMWSCVMLLSLIAWICSTIFHTHDTKTTEELDYYSELAFVFSSFCAILVKILLDHIDLVGILQNQLTRESRNGRAPSAYLLHRPMTVEKGYFKLHSFLGSRIITLLVPCIGYYVYHIYYMHSIVFDYGYHLNVNLFIAAFTSISWAFWIGGRFFTHRKSFIPPILESKKSSQQASSSSTSSPYQSYRYLWKCITCLIGANIVLLLELYDFPPFFYVFDAHALWHASTAPFYLLWYSFLSDEFFTSYLRELINSSNIEEQSHGAKSKPFITPLNTVKARHEQSDNTKTSLSNDATEREKSKNSPHSNGLTKKDQK